MIYRWTATRFVNFWCWDTEIEIERRPNTDQEFIWCTSTRLQQRILKVELHWIFWYLWAKVSSYKYFRPPKSIIPTDHVSSVFTHQSTLLIIQTVINLFGKHRIFNQCEWFPESIKLYLLKQCPFDYDSWRKTQQRSIITALQSQAHNMSHWFIHPPTTISTKYAAEYSEINDKIRLRLVSKKYRQN